MFFCFNFRFVKLQQKRREKIRIYNVLIMLLHDNKAT